MKQFKEGDIVRIKSVEHQDYPKGPGLLDGMDRWYKEGLLLIIGNETDKTTLWVRAAPQYFDYAPWWHIADLEHVNKSKLKKIKSWAIKA